MFFVLVCCVSFRTPRHRHSSKSFGKVLSVRRLLQLVIISSTRIKRIDFIPTVRFWLHKNIKVNLCSCWFSLKKDTKISIITLWFLNNLVNVSLKIFLVIISWKVTINSCIHFLRLQLKLLLYLSDNNYILFQSLLIHWFVLQVNGSGLIYFD